MKTYEFYDARFYGYMEEVGGLNPFPADLKSFPEKGK